LFIFSHEKKDFAKALKNLVDKTLYSITHIVLKIPNYFDGPTKLFSDLHSTKFLDILKSFFPCNNLIQKIIIL